MPLSHPVTTPPPQPDRDVQEQEAVLQIFLATVHHYFGSFNQLFAPVTDPRQPALITYPLAALLVAGLLLFICHLGARRQINHKLRGNQASAATHRPTPAARRTWAVRDVVGCAAMSTW
jgi:hypothetical protein